MGQELRRKVEAPGSASGDDSGADSATDASDEEADALQDLSKPSKKAIAKAKAAAMDIMQSEMPVPLLMAAAQALCQLRPAPSQLYRGVTFLFGCETCCVCITLTHRRVSEHSQHEQWPRKF